MEFRTAREEDYYEISPQINDWWGGREIAQALPRWFFSHFRDTILIAEEGGRIVAFVAGFMSQARPDEAYIHFTGVHPDYRRQGLARRMYDRFFDLARDHNRTVVRCCTGEVNRLSVKFHTGIGFELEPSPDEIDGLPLHKDYFGPGRDMFLFVKQLD